MEDVAWAWHAYPCDWHNVACTTNRKSLAARRHSNLWTFDADPLQPPDEWVEGAIPAMATAPLCTRCVDKLKYFIEQRRIQILGKLEDYFDCDVD
ncbi:hypothetical protein PsYK624_056660 [Phanerochaete sordida]|uniref:Uncharacterized protein n=1 Tax=Phanerochaete sordida TaxID=48140 RepID=A0A9P3LCS6_9APHY|nr:hypothetical protein PsYK624_056660 [Phanerochaete sordida]